MINASNEFNELITKSGRRIYADISIKLQTGEVLEIPQEKLRGLVIEDDVSGKNSFDIGAVISNQCTIKIDNTDEAYIEKEFDQAVVTVKIGLQLSETIEWLNKGTFIAEPGEESGSVITIKACDNVKMFDFPYADSNLIYPATLRQIVQDACDMCGVSFVSPSSDEFDYVVQARPDDELLTFRQVLRWAGQIACCWFRCNAHGALQAGFYNLDAYESDAEEHFHQIKHMQSFTRSTDDIVITGVRVVQEIDSGEVTYQSGEDGYVLSIEGNELIQDTNGESVAAKLGEKLVGVKFRKFATSHQSDPRIEAGDLAMITDRKGKVYKSLITSTAFQLGGIQRTACGAESPSRNSSARYSESTKTYVAMRKLVREERTARETAIEKLEKTLGDGSGLYMSTEEMEDGSFIYYAHNKPTIEESDIIWLMTAEAIGISTDGGKTYPYGFVVDGELITRILQTEGVNADWINAGTLVVKDAQGNVIFSVNMDSHEVLMDADHIMIGGGKTLSQMVEESKSLHVILSNEYQGIPADSSGNITAFPTCATTVQVLYGQSDITGKCTLSATASAGVTGSLSGTTYTVTALAADTGYVDIKATYLTMTATKRFTISKVKGGSNVKMLNTDLSLTQEMLTERGAVGHSRNWTVMTATTGLNAGDSVIIQVYNSSKDNSEAFIMATVNEVLSTNRINATSAGLLDKGDSGRVYSLEPSVTVIKRGQDSIPVPDAITFSAFYRDGGSASRTAYAGRFVVETSTDGNTWSKVYTSAADETSCKYELYTALEDGSGNYIEDGNGNVLVARYDESSVMMRATLYAAGGTNSSLDMQTVPVVIDVAALTHWQIFNLLTNDGTWEGLYHENGHLYINASVLAAGIIRSKDGKSVVIDLDNGNVDLVGNIRTKKTLLYDETTGLYLQCQLDGTGIHVEIYELINGTYNLIGETWVRDGLIEMSQTNGYGANYGTNEVLLTNSANGTRVRVANEPNAAQLELVANYDTVGDPLMAVATSTRRYITGLTDPEYPLWAVNKRYVDNLVAGLQAQIDDLKG